MIDQTFVAKIAKEVGATPENTAAAIKLFDHGATVPFVEHYRKDAHGGLGGKALARIQALNARYTAISNRRAAVIENLESNGLLTEDLRAQVQAADSMTLLEDLYMPFKRQRRTKGTIAASQGLDTLADFLAEQLPINQTIEEFAATYVRMDAGVTSPEAALDGACHIFAERIAADTAVRTGLRRRMREEGLLTAKAAKHSEENAAAARHFAPYFDFAKPLAKLTPEQLLTVLRGGRQGFLRTDLVIDDNAAVEEIVQRWLKQPGTPFDVYIRHIAGDAYRRLLRPTLESEVLQEVRDAAEDQILESVRDQFQHLLMSPPGGKLMTLGVAQDGKSGYKMALVDREGRFVEHGNLQIEGSQEQMLAARDVLKLLTDKHPIDVIAVCSGPGSREFSRFLAENRRKVPNLRAFTVFVSEAGVSAYASGKESKEEFPDLDIPVRAAITVARRFQDPLAEFVKLEPRTLGLGGLAHDVTQKRLKDELSAVIELCVNLVGVDLNAAQPDMIRYVSGIQLGAAQNIAAWRKEHGSFKSREQLRGVSGVGERTFDQAAGFLFVRGGDEPLDTTRIHPEAYELVRKAAASVNAQVRDLIRNENLIRSINWEALADEKFGPLYLADVRDELIFPGRERRRRFRMPQRDAAVERVDQLTEGHITEGIVTNVTDFGAFVDIGVHQDGLIHLSELANRYVKNPREVVLLGETVRVKVVGIDSGKNRISLSRKAVPQDFRRKPAEPGERRPERGAEREGGFAGRPRGAAPGPEGARAQRFERSRPGAPGQPGERPRRQDAPQPRRDDKRKPARPRQETSISVGGDGPMGTSLADQLAALKAKLEG